jgi:Flp pilus assembly protein TadG
MSPRSAGTPAAALPAMAGCRPRRLRETAPRHQRIARGLAARLDALRGNDDGYNIVEFMLTFVALIVITMVVIQFALLWHARHVAQAAAQDALRTASNYQSTADAGQSDGYAYLHQVAPNLVLDPHVTVTRNATTVNVDVTGHVLSIGPFTMTVHESASGPVERGTP